jgi:F-type H+/Na+-transporting ATPase subunit alpha
MDISNKDVRRFNKELISFMEDKYPQVGQAIASTGELKSETEELLKKGIEEFKLSFMNSR